MPSWQSWHALMATEECQTSLRATHKQLHGDRQWNHLSDWLQVPVSTRTANMKPVQKEDIKFLGDMSLLTKKCVTVWLMQDGALDNSSMCQWQPGQRRTQTEDVYQFH